MSRNDDQKNDTPAKYIAHPHISHDEKSLTGGGGTITRETESSTRHVGAHYHAPSGTSTIWGGATKELSDSMDATANGQASSDGSYNVGVGFRIKW